MSMISGKIGKKTLFAGIILTFVAVVGGITLLIFSAKANYEYNKQIYSYWSLATKASTLQTKAQYFDQFVLAIESAHLSGNNALLFKTPDNSYEQNFATLKSAQERLHDVQSLDPTSFQYSQTIGQVAAAGSATLAIFKGIWYLKYYPVFWGWFPNLELFLFVIVLMAGTWLILFSVLASSHSQQDPTAKTATPAA